MKVARPIVPLAKVLLFWFVLQGMSGPILAMAQVVTSITPTTGAGSLGTVVAPPVGNTYNVTGGTRAGTNLFHSFGNFSVGSGDTANFLNTPLNGALPFTTNILGRVTGGNISNLFGTIQTTGYGNANLFLMNPAGFLFGPNATVNIGGMVTFTSADYLRLTDGGRFNASVFPVVPDLLTAAPVAAFGFLGSNPGAITVLGSHLTVADGTGISLVGGNITVQSGTLDDGTVQPARLSAPGGQMNLASVTSPGEVLADNFMPSTGMAMGNINLSQGSVLDVSTNATASIPAGAIRIRSGQLVIADATLSADTANANGAPVAIDVNVTGDLSITDTRGLPAITARTTGSGNAGAIQLVSGNLTASTTFLDPSFLPTTLIDSHTSGEGRGGDISIATGHLTATGTPDGGNIFTFIDSGTMANGRGGDVSIAAQTVEITRATITTGQLNASAFVEDLSTVNGSAGNLTITANTLRTLDAAFDTSALFGTSPLQRGGDIKLTAHDISVTNTQVSSINTNGGGALTIKADSLVADFTSFDIETISGPGGGITFQGRVLELTNGSPMISSTLGSGNAGDIQITATDHVSLIGDNGTNVLAPFQPSGLFSNSFGTIFGSLGGPGNAGNISVTTPSLTMVGGRINTVTSGSGSGGNVTLNVSNAITISGEFPSEANIVPSILTNGPLAPSGITTETVGSAACAAVCGNAGNITINTGLLTLGQGGQINSGTGSTGQGGNISIHATDSIALSGTLTDGSPVGIFSRSIGTDPGSGSGGNITLHAGQSVTVSEGAQVSASTTGPGNAGNITVQGLASPTQSVVIDGAGSGVFTNTEGTGSGGNIFVNADSVTLSNGGTLSATTSGTDPSATGGTITVLSDQLALQSGATITSSTSGAGDGGTVLLNATQSISLSNSTVASNSEPSPEISAVGHGGQLSLTAPSISLERGSALLAKTLGPGNAGSIAINAGTLNLTDTSVVQTSTSGTGSAGNISIQGLGGAGTKAQAVSLNGASSLSSNSSGNDEGEGGAAGNVLVETQTLSLSGGSQITTSSFFSPGDAGTITINAGESVQLSQGILTSRSESNIPDEFVNDYVIGNAGSIIVSSPAVTLTNNSRMASTSDSRYPGDPSKGNAGSITVNTTSLSLTGGSQLTSSSVVGDSGQPPVGNAGTVTVQGLPGSAQSVLINGAGSGLFTATQGSGLGGDITVSAQTVTLQNSAQISSSSTGTGPAGNIAITANQTFTAVNSSVTTEANHSSGGIIKITTNPSGTVELTNSTISASVLDGTGGGGSVSIDPQFVILQNSQILAQAAQGPGGNILINITNDGLFLPDANSVLSAKSGNPALNGTVTIQSPNAPAGGKIQPLGKAPLQVTALLSQRCAAIARGEVSSFVVAGRDTLPTEPGGWLTSPLAFGPSEAGSAIQAGNRGVPSESSDPTILSLRRLPSPSKVAQLLSEDDWLSGCGAS